MRMVYTDLIELTEKARSIHRQERRISLESLKLIGELEERKAWYYLDMSVEVYAVHIGLTPSIYWKRAMAARVINRFPEASVLFDKGETEISQLAMIAGRITDANAMVLIEGIRNKTKREVEAFISRVGSDGRILDREEMTEITIRLTAAQRAALERARELLADDGHIPTNAEVLCEATQDLLNRRDPVQRAAREEARTTPILARAY
ncbi:MAG: PhoH family protein [Chitinophagaceae bacterium]|nr:PhoH family protein [Oligoflexus sp.]